MVFSIYVSNQKCEGSMDLLLLTNDNKSHYTTLKILTHLCFIKQKLKNKKWFCKSCL